VIVSIANCKDDKLLLLNVSFKHPVSNDFLKKLSQSKIKRNCTFGTLILEK
jgi:hypothetical protein